MTFLEPFGRPDADGATPTNPPPPAAGRQCSSGDPSLLSILIQKGGLAALAGAGLAPMSALKSNLPKQEISLFLNNRVPARAGTRPWDSQHRVIPGEAASAEAPRSLLSLLVREGCSGLPAAPRAGDDAAGRQNAGDGGFATAKVARVATVGVARPREAYGGASQPHDSKAFSAVNADLDSRAERAAFDAEAVASLATVATVAAPSPPPRLVVAAVRVCRELHGDDDAAIQVMFGDLLAYAPGACSSLIPHFEQQLLDRTPLSVSQALVTCRGCVHVDYPHHPAIAHCRAGCHSGLVTGGFWASDRHACAMHQPLPSAGSQ